MVEDIVQLVVDISVTHYQVTRWQDFMIMFHFTTWLNMNSPLAQVKVDQTLQEQGP